MASGGTALVTCRTGTAGLRCAKRARRTFLSNAIVIASASAHRAYRPRSTSQPRSTKKGARGRSSGSGLSTTMDQGGQSIARPRMRGRGQLKNRNNILSFQDGFPIRPHSSPESLLHALAPNSRTPLRPRPWGRPSKSATGLGHVRAPQPALFWTTKGKSGGRVARPVTSLGACAAGVLGTKPVVLTVVANSAAGECPCGDLPFDRAHGKATPMPTATSVTIAETAILMI